MRHKRLLVVLAIICFAIAVPSLLFFIRPPVLIITDVPFVALYGEKRLRQQRLAVSATLFRRVKPILAADSASPDMLMYAISEAAPRPFCVLFPRSQTQAAARYHEYFPEIPVALLNGTVPVSGFPAPDGILCVYTTDRKTDLYRAGLFAGILGTAVVNAEGGKEGSPAQKPPFRRTYVLWQDPSAQAAGGETFSLGLKEQDPEAIVILTSSASQIPEDEEISCAVVTGAGTGYFDKNYKVPTILFSWLNPAYTAREVSVIFDDSPWALADAAVQMAVKGQAEGAIPSKPLILSEKAADKSIFRILKKSKKKYLD